MNNFTSLINGEFSETVSVLDRGLAYGDGLFETMSWRYIKQSKKIGVEFWKRHLKRIKIGCEKLKIKFPSEKKLEDYKRRVLLASFKKGLREGTLKILISRGVGGRGYKFEKDIKPTIIFLTFPKTTSNNIFREKGVKVKLCRFNINSNVYLSSLKHLNRLDSVMARSEWTSKEFFEGILLDSNGNLIEGTMTNIFFSRKNILYTPKIQDSGINGIMRQVVIEKAKLFFEKIVFKNIRRSDLRFFEEMFITNSVIKIIPVKSILEKKFIITNSTKKLINYFSDECNEIKNLELL
ncbi:MAG: aminodeoxychorismate lyase [Alphaproteobacteria bacterium]